MKPGAVKGARHVSLKAGEGRPPLMSASSYRSGSRLSAGGGLRKG
jgi:hypothetical protein